MSEQTIISVRVQPSFAPGYTIELRQRYADDSFYVQCTSNDHRARIFLMRQAAEAYRKKHPERRLIVSDLAIPDELTWEREVQAAAGSSLCNLLYDTPITHVAEPKYEGFIYEVLDGTDYRVTIGQLHATSTFHWYGDVPNGWSHLETLARQLKQLGEVDAVFKALENGESIPQ